jgi:hypothetical protein
MASKDKGRKEVKKPKAKKAKAAPTTSIMPPQRPATDSGASSS